MDVPEVLSFAPNGGVYGSLGGASGDRSGGVGPGAAVVESGNDGASFYSAYAMKRASETRTVGRCKLN
jgi:hypothetical protein